MGEALSGAKEGHDYVHTRFGLETHSLHLTTKASVKRKPANAGGMVGWSFGRIVPTLCPDEVNFEGTPLSKQTKIMLYAW